MSDVENTEPGAAPAEPQVDGADQAKGRGEPPAAAEPRDASAPSGRWRMVRTVLLSAVVLGVVDIDVVYYGPRRIVGCGARCGRRLGRA